MNSKVLTGLAFIMGEAVASRDTCFALAFGSGAETSAYQAGVLKGLILENGSAEHYYTAISGMSGGGINTAIRSTYAMGSDYAAAERMIKFWQDASNTRLYKDFPGGVAQGFALEGGLYNNTLLLDFLEL